jgi:hypothetical protein
MNVAGAETLQQEKQRFLYAWPLILLPLTRDRYERCCPAASLLNLRGTADGIQE